VRSQRAVAVKDRVTTIGLAALQARAITSARVRLSSLDAFRGLTMAAMVVVNNPGTWSAVYGPLEHAEWHGWTPTDLVFPFFLFIVGISMTLSRQTVAAPWWRLARRAAIIVGLGLFMAGFPFFNPSHWRIPGVLQRIGICYLAAALIFRWTSPRIRTPHDDRVRCAVLASIAGVILLGYWFVMMHVAAPGGVAGDLTPDGNLGAYIDRALMRGHLWRQDWDPEGLLSTVPAIATTILGAIAGVWLQAPVPAAKRVLVLAGTGGILFLAGEAWHRTFPINKQLWTSSYVLMSAGAAAIVLGLCIQLIDVRGFARWSRPFVVLGSNAIALFVLSGLIGKLLIIIRVSRGSETTSLQSFIYEHGFSWLAAPKNASLIYALTFLAMMYGFCAVLYRRGIFLKA
jgi:predicted acyltransferase